MMDSQVMNRKDLGLALLIIAIATTLMFVNCFGTSDVILWSQWNNIVAEKGLIDGFAAIKSTQPPLKSAMIRFVGVCAEYFEASFMQALKWSVAIMLFLSSFIFLCWCKDLLATALFMFAFSLNTGLGYLDVYYLPFMILAFIAIQKDKFWLLLLTAIPALFIKSQVMIALPVFCAYFASLRNLSIQENRRAIGFGLIVAAVFCALVFIYGDSILGFLVSAETGNYLSGNALNLAWIGGYVDSFFGGHQMHSNRSIDHIVASPEVAAVYKSLFFILSGFTLLYFVSLRREYRDNLASFLRLFVSIYLIYFTCNSGVHENHLFLAVAGLAALSVVDKRFFSCYLFFAFMLNFNMALFYGFSGNGSGIYRVVWGYDLSAVVALVNSAFGLFACGLMMSQMARENRLVPLAKEPVTASSSKVGDPILDS